MSFEPLKRAIAARATADPKMRDIQIARIFEASRQALAAVWGAERAALVQPLSFREGVLRYETTSGVAKQQISLDQIRLKNEINRRLGGMVVRVIQVQGKGF